MFILDIKVNGRKCIAPKKSIYSGSVGIDKVKFSFSEEWEGLTKTAIFYQEQDNVYPVLLDDENIAKIPYEVLEEIGILKIGVFGVTADGKVIPSSIIEHELEEGITRDANLEPGEYENVYVQVLSMYTSLKASVDTLITDIEELKLNTKTIEYIAKGAQYAKTFQNYEFMINELNLTEKNEYKIGDNFYIHTLDVPDIWVAYCTGSSVEYIYTSDEDFVADLKSSTAGVQVGHYYLAPLETAKVDLPEYVKKSLTIAGLTLYKNISEYELAEKLGITSAFGTAVEYHILLLANLLFGKAEIAEAFRKNATALFGDNADVIFGSADAHSELMKVFATLEQLATIESIAKGAQVSKSFNDYSELIEHLNACDGTEYKLGQNFYIKKLEVPDVWISGDGSTDPTEYSYTTDDEFIEQLKTTNGVQVGNYWLSPLETGKVPLENYLKIAQGTDYVNRVMAVNSAGNIEPIEANKLGFIISSTLVNGGSWYSSLIPWLISHCGSKYEEDLNTSARHTHDNKDFLDGLSQEILDEKADTTYVDNKLNEIKLAQMVDELPEVGLDGVLYLVSKSEPDTNDLYDEYKYINGAWEFMGSKQITIDLSEYVKKDEIETAIETAKEETKQEIAKSDEWQLLHQYELAEDTATILDFDTFDFANKYKAIRICLSNQYSKNAQSIYCYLNEESMTYLMNLSAGASSSNCRYDFTFINEPFYTQTFSMTIKAKLDRHVTGASQLTSYVNTSNVISKIEDIKGMKIVFQGEGTFPAGTRISILGKEA